jgi:high-affinity Fe2+/Pb2+ permease
MSYLVNEILLRLAKAVVALLLGLALYVLLTSVGGATSSIELGLLCFLAAAALILLVQESPI